mgnify:CR=1 FL=1
MNNAKATTASTIFMNIILPPTQLQYRPSQAPSINGKNTRSGKKKLARVRNTSISIILPIIPLPPLLTSSFCVTHAHLLHPWYQPTNGSSGATTIYRNVNPRNHRMLHIGYSINNIYPNLPLVTSSKDNPKMHIPTIAPAIVTAALIVAPNTSLPTIQSSPCVHTPPSKKSLILGFLPYLANAL